MFAFGISFHSIYEILLFIAGTIDVKPVLTVKTERDDMPSTSHHEGSNEGRYVEMSSKQEAVTRGLWFIKNIFELSQCSKL